MKMYFSENRLLILVVCFFFISCKNKTGLITSSDDEGYDKNLSNSNYDWTGTYELKDKEVLYTLKLHKRSVDASYEMQFYNNSEDADLYKSSVYDAKDDDSTISIKFLNNFNMDASPLGFKSGDTLFILNHLVNNTDTTVFKKFFPESSNAKWIKISSLYN